ncbi:hypothetical protein SKAU_G00302850 [Synaphobranchus kaupii]|uniref:Uncharacterized protein n=1 Tax=Synaphobranchus kaupii TaxID=118154 RepID=A0A9Q1IMH0_SYNKA|nr:hypothetical protein SKAU_G00302850 [Synaphobranchus kaupii]
MIKAGGAGPATERSLNKCLVSVGQGPFTLAPRAHTYTARIWEEINQGEIRGQIISGAQCDFSSRTDSAAQRGGGGIPIVSRLGSSVIRNPLEAQSPLQLPGAREGPAPGPRLKTRWAAEPLTPAEESRDWRSSVQTTYPNGPDTIKPFSCNLGQTMLTGAGGEGRPGRG